MKIKDILKMVGEAFGFLFCVGLAVLILGLEGIADGSNDHLTRGTIEFLKLFE